MRNTRGMRAISLQPSKRPPLHANLARAALQCAAERADAVLVRKPRYCTATTAAGVSLDLSFHAAAAHCCSLSARSAVGQLKVKAMLQAAACIGSRPHPAVKRAVAAHTHTRVRCIWTHQASAPHHRGAANCKCRWTLVHAHLQMDGWSCLNGRDAVQCYQQPGVMLGVKLMRRK